MNFEGSCQLVHDGLCVKANILKGLQIGRVGLKYYIPFHLVPFLLRLRKCKDLPEFCKLLGRTSVEYMRSVLFMVSLVVGMKVGRCMSIHG